MTEFHTDSVLQWMNAWTTPLNEPLMVSSTLQSIMYLQQVFFFYGTVGVGVGSGGFNTEFSRKQRFNLMQDDDPPKNICEKW